MSMDDEKFFEELAKGKAEADSGVEIGLAKASSIASRGVAAQKISTKTYDDEPEGQLAIDVYQTPSEIMVESAIAGVKPEDIDINVTNDSVVIKGERRRGQEVKEDNYFYRECYWGRFSRSVILPQEVDPEGAGVSFKNGILIVRLPKLNRKKSKK